MTTSLPALDSILVTNDLWIDFDPGLQDPEEGIFKIMVRDNKEQTDIAYSHPHVIWVGLFTPMELIHEHMKNHDYSFTKIVVHCQFKPKQNQTYKYFELENTYNYFKQKGNSHANPNQIILYSDSSNRPIKASSLQPAQN